MTTRRNGGTSSNHSTSLLTTINGGSGRGVPCGKCGKMYSTRSIMLRHMNHECGVEKKIVCEVCQKKFRRKWNLEQHMKRLHYNSYFR